MLPTRVLWLMFVQYGLTFAYAFYFAAANPGAWFILVGLLLGWLLYRVERLKYVD